MKTILAHGRYEVLLGEERVSDHPLGDPLQLVFSADEVTAVREDRQVEALFLYRRFDGRTQCAGLLQDQVPTGILL